MPRRKLLHVIETLGRGGAETELVYLLPALQQKGLQCEVAAILPPFDLAPELEDAGVAVHRLNIGWHWNIPRVVAALTSLIRRGGYDIVHAHSFLAGISVGLTKPFLPRVKRVVTFHNLGYDSYPASNWKRKLLKSANGIVMRNCFDQYIAVSAPVAEHYARHLRLLGTMTMIPNAFPTQTSRASGQEAASIRARYGISTADFLCVVPGRFVLEKGHRYLIEAHALLREWGLPVKTLLFVRGPLEQTLARQVEEQGLQSEVRILGPVPRHELMEILASAQLLALPSTHEGFPLAPAEAMLLGIPVVATSVGGIPELIEDGESGLLVPPRDPGALAAAVRKLYSGVELRKRIGEQGRKRVEDKFSLQAIVPAWEQFYEGVLADDTN